MEWLEVKLEQIEKAATAGKSDGNSWDFDFSFDFGGVATTIADGIIRTSDGNGGYTFTNTNNPNFEWHVDSQGHTVGDIKYNTGGYTGVFANTGMYTGEWADGSNVKNGRLAWLHQKELVLNAHDTENFLDAMNIVRQLDNLTSWMANGLGDLFSPHIESTDGTLQQEVHIDASFPNVTDHNEIEEAFGNLVNLASQYANRKSFS